LVRALDRRLDREPDTVWENVTAHWPYTIERHAFRVAGDAGLLVVETATGRIVHGKPLRAHAGRTDTTIRNPNPDIGLQADPLELPPVEGARRDVREQLAAEAAAQAVRAILAHRAAELQDRARALADAGKTARALEARVIRALFLAHSDPDESNRLLTTLQQQIQQPQ
jgi:hypothetical protein